MGSEQDVPLRVAGTTGAGRSSIVRHAESDGHGAEIAGRWVRCAVRGVRIALNRLESIPQTLLLQMCFSVRSEWLNRMAKLAAGYYMKW